MNKEQWAEIYDIARRNGFAAHHLIVELCAANPDISESELLVAAQKWSRDRTNYVEV